MFIVFPKPTDTDERTVNYPFPLKHTNPNIRNTQAHVCARCGEKKGGGIKKYSEGQDLCYPFGFVWLFCF